MKFCQCDNVEEEKGYFPGSFLLGERGSGYIGWDTTRSWPVLQ